MPNAFQRTMQRVAKGLFGVNFGTPGVDTWQEAWDWVRGIVRAESGHLEEPYRQHAAVAIAIGTIAEDAASVEWEFFPEGEGAEANDPIDDHPLLAIWRKPNAWMSGNQLFIGTYISYQLFGEAFWYYPDLRLARRGSPRELQGRLSGGEIELLDPRMVKHKVNADRTIQWMLRVNGVDQPLDSDRLTQFKRFNPYVSLSARGLSKVEAVILEAKGDFAAQAWNERFFGDGNGIPTGLLIPSLENPAGSTTPEQRRQIVESWNERHHRRRIGIVPPGWDWKELGVNARDMDFRALREYSREQILGMFGVPPFLAGVLDKANYANAREQKEVYWQGTITRLLRHVQETLNHDFLPKIGVTGVEVWPRWEVIAAMLEDLSEKVEIAERLWKMGVPFAAINDRLELGFDTDEMEAADVGYIPIGLIPAGESGRMSPAGPVDEEGIEPQEEAFRLLDGRQSDRKRLLTAGDREVRRTLIWRNLVVRTRDLETAFARMMRSHTEELAKETLGNLGSLKGLGLRSGVFKEHVTEDIVFDLQEADRKLRRRSKELHRRAFQRGGESLIAEVGIAINFDMLDPVVLAKLAEHTFRIAGFNARLNRRIRDEIAEAIVAGEPMAKIRRRLVAQFDIAKARAETIARTEVGMAFSNARNIAMRQAGIDRHEWLSARDADVRDSHRLEDGSVAAVGEPFPNTKLLFPQDPSGPAEEIINCRCVALPVVDR